MFRQRNIEPSDRLERNAFRMLSHPERNYHEYPWRMYDVHPHPRTKELMSFVQTLPEKRRALASDVISYYLWSNNFREDYGTLGRPGNSNHEGRFVAALDMDADHDTVTEARTALGDFTKEVDCALWGYPERLVANSGYEYLYLDVMEIIEDTEGLMSKLGIVSVFEKGNIAEIHAIYRTACIKKCFLKHDATCSELRMVAVVDFLVAQHLHLPVCRKFWDATLQGFNYFFFSESDLYWDEHNGETLPIYAGLGIIAGGIIDPLLTGPDVVGVWSDGRDILPVNDKSNVFVRLLGLALTPPEVEVSGIRAIPSTMDLVNRISATLGVVTSVELEECFLGAANAVLHHNGQEAAGDENDPPSDGDDDASGAEDGPPNVSDSDEESGNDNEQESGDADEGEEEDEETAQGRRILQVINDDSLCPLFAMLLVSNGYAKARILDLYNEVRIYAWLKGIRVTSSRARFCAVVSYFISEPHLNCLHPDYDDNNPDLVPLYLDYKIVPDKFWIAAYAYVNVWMDQKPTVPRSLSRSCLFQKLATENMVWTSAGLPDLVDENNWILDSNLLSFERAKELSSVEELPDDIDEDGELEHRLHLEISLI